MSDITTEEHVEWFEAIRTNNVRKVKRMLKLGYNINAQYRDDSNRNGLMKSIFWENDDTFDLLLSYPEINVNLKDCFGRTALTYASNHAYRRYVKKLILHPKIDFDLNIEPKGNSFIDILGFDDNFDFLRNYELQNTILKNNQRNIFLFKKHDIITL